MNNSNKKHDDEKKDRFWTLKVVFYIFVLFGCIIFVVEFLSFNRERYMKKIELKEDTCISLMLDKKITYKTAKKFCKR